MARNKANQKQEYKTKRYFWLRLKDDFFKEPKIKKLRKIAGGDTYTCIYLKMMLYTIATDGIVEYEGIEESLPAELALKLDEDETNVSVVLSFLEKQGLMEEVKKNNYLLLTVPELTGSESETAKRVRKHRERKKQLSSKQNNFIEGQVLYEKEATLLQCNSTETKCNSNETEVKNQAVLEEMLQCNTDETKCNGSETKCNTTETECNSTETECNFSETKCNDNFEKNKKPSTPLNIGTESNTPLQCNTDETKCNGSETKCNKKLTTEKERDIIYNTTTTIDYYIPEESGSSKKENYEEIWLSEKSKTAKNQSAYYASLKKKLQQKEKSVIDEFVMWKNTFIKKEIEQNKLKEKLKFFIGKNIKTTKGFLKIINFNLKNNQFVDFLLENGATVPISVENFKYIKIQ